MIRIPNSANVSQGRSAYGQGAGGSPVRQLRDANAPQVPTKGILAKAAGLARLGNAVASIGDPLEQFALQKQDAINSSMLAEGQTIADESWANYNNSLATNYDSETYVSGWQETFKNTKEQILGNPDLAPVVRDRLAVNLQRFEQGTMEQIQKKATAMDLSRARARFDVRKEQQERYGDLPGLEATIDQQAASGLIAPEEAKMEKVQAKKRIQFNEARNFIDDPNRTVDELEDFAADLGKNSTGKRLAPDKGSMRVKVTKYGYPGDPYWDSNSGAGKGAWNHKAGKNYELKDNHSVGLMAHTAAKLGAEFEDVLEITLPDGSVIERVYNERIPLHPGGDRIDFYMSTDEQAEAFDLDGKDVDIRIKGAGTMSADEQYVYNATGGQSPMPSFDKFDIDPERRRQLERDAKAKINERSHTRKMEIYMHPHENPEAEPISKEDILTDPSLTPEDKHAILYSRGNPQKANPEEVDRLAEFYATEYNTLQDNESERPGEVRRVWEANVMALNEDERRYLFDLQDSLEGADGAAFSSAEKEGARLMKAEVYGVPITKVDTGIPLTPSQNKHNDDILDAKREDVRAIHELIAKKEITQPNIEQKIKDAFLARTNARRVGNAAAAGSESFTGTSLLRQGAEAQSLSPKQRKDQIKANSAKRRK